MQKLGKLLVCSLIVLLTGCLANPFYNEAIKPREELQRLPIKIGILADSQLTTSRETFSPSDLQNFRGPKDDEFKDVSLRPPALEYLSRVLLEYFLQRLVEENVDLILYLGDAANSGCQDELAGAFASLARIRDDEEHPIPTYFLIGNHDYLTTGNQTKMALRRELCDRTINGEWPEHRNKPVTKQELISMVHAHNKRSGFKDKNFHYLAKVPEPIDPELVDTCDEGHKFHYYAAALRPKDPTSVSTDILLADTSDYNNVWFRPTIKLPWSCESLAFWGLKGSMSSRQILELQGWGCSQGGEFCDVDEAGWNNGINPQFGVDYRFVASHYDPASFNMVNKWEDSPSYVRDNLGFLLSDGENIWLGAHHHYTAPHVTRYSVGTSIRRGPRGDFAGFSVGSTTDYFPHAAVIEAKDNNGRNNDLTARVGYRTINAPDEYEICTDFFSRAASRIKALRGLQCGEETSVYHDMSAKLGLARVYEREGCYSQRTYETVRRNIDHVLDAYGPEETQAKRNAKLCLAIKSTIAEGMVTVPE